MSQQATSIRSHLIWLILITATPILLFAVFLVQRDARQERAVLERELQETVRTLALAVDRELARTRAILGTLAGTRSLAGQDMRAFHDEASQAAAQVSGSWIVLSEPSGRQLMNTLVPYGDPLPHGNAPEFFSEVLESGAARVSNLFTGAVAGRHIITQAIPVAGDGVDAWILDMAFGPEAFTELLAAQPVPSHAVAAITDGNGRVVARSSGASSYIGSDFWIRGVAGQTEGMLTARSPNGRTIDVALYRSSMSPWTVGLAVFREAVEAPWREQFWTLVAGGTGLIALALTLAAFLGSRIATAVQSLSTAATALGNGELRKARPGAILEVNQVQEALARADEALTIRARERERLAAEQAARREAESQNESKDVFLAMLAHELRSPLAGIVNATTLLDQICADDPNLQRVLGLMRRQLHHLGRLLDELLDVARITHDKIDLRIEHVDLRDVIEPAVQAESADFELKSQTLELDLPDEPVTVMGDPVRLRQVVGNLLNNAHKYSPSRTKVTLGLRPQGDEAELWVTDRGYGIPQDRLETLFELFTRLPESDRQPGLGIGLPLVRRLVELHGGTVQAASRGENLGATFTVRLPLAGPRRDA